MISDRYGTVCTIIPFLIDADVVNAARLNQLAVLLITDYFKMIDVTHDPIKSNESLSHSDNNLNE